MRRLLGPLALVVLLALGTGCDPTIANRGVVYPLVSGRFNLRWTPDVPGTTAVVVMVDGGQVGRATPTDGTFLVELDSRRFANGLHRLRLEALGDAGATLQVLEHALLIQN